MSNRASDWLSQAIRDFEQAEASRVEGRHEWACFAAHQAAEKAVKALLSLPRPGILGPCHRKAAEGPAWASAGTRGFVRDGQSPG